MAQSNKETLRDLLPAQSKGGRYDVQTPLPKQGTARNRLHGTHSLHEETRVGISNPKRLEIFPSGLLTHRATPFDKPTLPLATS